MSTDRKLFIALAVLMVTILITELSEAQVRSPRVRKAPTSSRMTMLISPLAQDFRLERGQNQGLEVKAYSSLSLALKFQKMLVSLETNYLKNSTGNSSSSVTTEYRDFNLWGSYVLTDYKFAQTEFYLSGDLGLGAYAGSVHTYYLGAERTDESSYKALAGLGLSAGAIHHFTPRWGVFFISQGRILFAESFDPNPSFGLTVRTGLSITF